MQDHATANDSGISRSTWMDVEVPLYGAELPRGLVVDVCVIGAGIVGLSTAYHLARDGANVVVIDDGPIGGGETGRTTAHLASALDDRFLELERMHGAEGARLAAASHAAAIDDIETIAARHAIACDLRRVDGYLFGPPEHRELIAREHDAARRAGLEVELIERAPLTGFDSGPCLRFARQAEFHPLAYLRGLAAAAVESGARIYTGVRAEQVESGPPARVVTDRGDSIVAGAVVVATNAPITSRVAIPLRQAAYRTYVLALQVPRGTVAAGLYWDTVDPYHYVRTAPTPSEPDHELLIVGGEDHKTGQNGDASGRWERLEAWAREHFPMARSVHARWSGQIMEPADGLAFIGRTGDRTFVATGDSGNGLTHGALAGMLLTDLVQGRPSPWAKLYDPHRTALRAAGSILRENANTAAQYADWISGGDVRSVDDITPGQGAVVRRGVHLIAVYRDDAGRCHERSASCTHLAGVVRWNSAERSWDCPCHGSRFDALGRVLNGPAVHDLAVVESERPGPRPPVEVEDRPSAPIGR